MSKSGRLVGIILIIVGILIWVVLSAVVASAVLGTETGTTGGLILGLAVVFIVGLPFVGAGIFLVIRGRAEEEEMVDVGRQRKILDMVKTRGQVDISDLVFELDANTDEIQDDIYKIVGLGLFTGYVNWDDGILYSVQASELTGNKCPNCGGDQTFAGKGVIKCQYCGSEIFL